MPESKYSIGGEAAVRNGCYFVMKEWQFWENPNKFPFDKFSEIQLYFLNGKAYNEVGNKSNFLCAFDG